jgi:hypothetical protein
MQNITCPPDAGKGLKLTSTVFNDTKASRYVDWCKLPGNDEHLAWMKKAETACEAELLKYVRNKTPWKGYNPALMVKHRHADGNFRSVVQYACLDSFMRSTSKEKRRKKVEALLRIEASDFR